MSVKVAVSFVQPRCGMCQGPLVWSSSLGALDAGMALRQDGVLVAACTACLQGMSPNRAVLP